MMKKVILLALAALLLVSLVGCSDTAKAVLSDHERVTTPEVAASDANNLVDGNTAFAFDLYRELSQQGDNLFFSPYSISLALAMTYAGASGDTELEMANTLHFAMLQSLLHPAFNALDLELAELGKEAKGKDGEELRLNIANALWGQDGFEFLTEFLDTLAENYGAGLRLVDFLNAREESRRTINDWVSEETEGKIEDLIPEGVIDPDTRLVLTNAIYLNAAWLHAFCEDVTAHGTFHLLDGSQVTVPMMSQVESFGYTQGEGYQAVELPYDGGELSMVILVPDSGHFANFEGSLDAAVVEDILKGLEETRLALSMPKFEFDSRFSLSQMLPRMGMISAFDPRKADFSGMTGDRSLYIADVLHKAFVSVDEAGTEAAAATAVVMKLTAAPDQPTQLTIDRPFIFLIRDVGTGTVLFMGRVLNPGT